jgi:16S rRNA (cytosine1402-N4)-methyltransferase
MHIPVLLQPLREIIKSTIGTRPRLTAIDATFGAGGYTTCLLNEFPNISTLYAIDRDPLAFSLASTLSKTTFPNRLVPILGPFSAVSTLIPQGQRADVILFDIGLSSMQIADEKRGFSFWLASPLDMRMDGKGDFTAFDVVNGTPECHLKEIFQSFGEEEFAFSIAKSIVKYRQQVGEIGDSKTLASIILSALPLSRKAKDWKKGVHPARKAFQAIRIVVNNEIQELQKGLSGAHSILNPNGLLAVTSFHALECRLVKEFFRKHSSEYSIAKSAVLPEAEEIDQNIRSRSARLRVAIKKVNELQ